MGVAVEELMAAEYAEMVEDGHSLFCHRLGYQKSQLLAHEGPLRVVLQPKLKLRADRKRYWLVFELDWFWLEVQHRGRLCCYFEVATVLAELELDFVEPEERNRMVEDHYLVDTAVLAVPESNIADLEIGAVGFHTHQHYKAVVELEERPHKCMLVDRMLAVEDGTLKPRATIHNRVSL
jgi:hypothetical protein